jgi:hypothetical protein
MWRKAGFVLASSPQDEPKMQADPATPIKPGLTEVMELLAELTGKKLKEKKKRGKKKKEESSESEMSVESESDESSVHASPKKKAVKRTASAKKSARKLK